MAPKLSFYVTPPTYGQICTVQFFDNNEPSNDKCFKSSGVMQSIKDMVDSNEFYYQFDFLPHASHCITARFEHGTLHVMTDNTLYCEVGSDALTEQWIGADMYYSLYPQDLKQRSN